MTVYTTDEHFKERDIKHIPIEVMNEDAPDKAHRSWSLLRISDKTTERISCWATANGKYHYHQNITLLSVFLATIQSRTIHYTKYKHFYRNLILVDSSRKKYLVATSKLPPRRLPAYLLDVCHSPGRTDMMWQDFFVKQFSSFGECNESLHKSS